MRSAQLGIAIVVLVVGCGELPPAATAANEHEPPPADPEYARVVSRVSEMVSNEDLASRVQRRGLSLVNVTWEDMGRAWGSALGPNISDFTLQVRHRIADRIAEPEDEGSWLAPPEPSTSGPLRWHETLMPVIRHPNFTDRTGDVPVDRFFVRVGNGNAGGRGLTSVPLIDVIRDLGRYASSPSSLSGTTSRAPIDLSASRDTHFLVSAQALFLPIPKRGRAEFNPVLFNYQSAPGSPAVLVLLATREGTSVTVVENRQEDQGVHWGQELYFNDGGQRACFTAERRSDVAQRIAAHGGPRNEAERSMLARGADVMALIQVPLVHDNRGVLGGMYLDGDGAGYGYQFSDDPLSAGLTGPNDATIRVHGHDVERAVLGHGAKLGPFVEGHGAPLARDPTFPIRVTLQFYKATTTGDVSDRDLDAIATSIESVYAHADFVGSLVVPEDDAKRPTAWQHVPGEWFPW
jgi:hypothetical protein